MNHPLIPAGKFQVGDLDQPRKPRREKLPAFYLARYPVTNEPGVSLRAEAIRSTDAARLSHAEFGSHHLRATQSASEVEDGGSTMTERVGAARHGLASGWYSARKTGGLLPKARAREQRQIFALHARRGGCSDRIALRDAALDVVRDRDVDSHLEQPIACRREPLL